MAASACVAIIIGVVQQTGIASDFSSAISEVVQSNLLLALIGIMGCSLVLGMGVPSVVCYLLMATLMGSLLEQLGVQPLAAHLFIFYFGMMSMVTPPVALAAYASASIADAKIMPTSMAAFRFSLVGFLLPFMFIYRPSLLLLETRDMSTRLTRDQTANKMIDLGTWENRFELAIALGTAELGILALSACIAGYMAARLSALSRVLLFVAAMLLLCPDVVIDGYNYGHWMNGGSTVLVIAIWIGNWIAGKKANDDNEPGEQEPAAS